KQYGHARLVEVLQKSEERVAPPCPIYEACGGCQLQHLSYEGQLRWKRQMVVDNLRRIGKLDVADRVDELDVVDGGGRDGLAKGTEGGSHRAMHDDGRLATSAVRSG